MHLLRETLSEQKKKKKKKNFVNITNNVRKSNELYRPNEKKRMSKNSHECFKIKIQMVNQNDTNDVDDIYIICTHCMVYMHIHTTS